MTQADKILGYLKTRGSAGATAKELTDLFVPQYNWCIMSLRRKGYRIASVKEKDPYNGNLRWRFYYKGRREAA